MAEPVRGAAPLDRIVVVGGGQVALLAAIALARALPPARVVLVDAPVAPDALADLAHTGLSGVDALFARLGIEEKLLVARASASHRLAVQYHRWNGANAFAIAYGAAARDAAAGFMVGVPAISAALAEAECLLPMEHPIVADVAPALRWDPRSLCDGLKSLASQTRVERAAAPFADVLRDPDGRISGVLSTDGRSIVADLIVDASGPVALVHSRASAAARTDWSKATPIDRLCRLACPAPPRLSLNDHVSGGTHGYSVESPGRDATRWWQAWSSLHWTDEAAQEQVAGASRAAPDAPIHLRPGRASEPWSGRVVAIGDAAAIFEPLGWVNMHLAALQILLLLDLLPGKSDNPVERVEYNRRAALLAERAHDFVAAHHPDHAASPFLALRRDQFAHRGWLPSAGEDSIPLDLWAQLLIGQNAGPGPLPRLMATRMERREAVAGEHCRRLATALAAARPYPTWLREQFGVESAT